MSLIVVDASVAIKWMLHEEGHLSARELLRTYVSGENELIAPRIVAEEIASALSRRVRAKKLTAGIASRAFDFLELYMPVLADDAYLVREALTLSLRLQLSLWDCLYLALAIRTRSTLVTADRRLHRSASPHYPFVDFLE